MILRYYRNTESLHIPFALACAGFASVPGLASGLAQSAVRRATVAVSAKGSHGAWALYLFLVAAADVRGLSYDSDAVIRRHLKIDLLQLAAGHQQLERADLIAYRKPLYQVLSLPELSPKAPLPSPARRPNKRNQWATFFAGLWPETPHDRVVLVQCAGVRHLASQDQSGKWRTISRREELQGVVEVVRLES